MALISVDSAREMVLAAASPLPSERVPLAEGLGRTLAEPVIARRDQPPFAASAMDGYALRSTDAEAGATLRVIGEARAGQRYAGSLSSGTAVRIFTGAPVPEGADCVIMQEETQRDGDGVTLTVAGRAGQNIRAAAYDFRDGAELLSAGRVLDAPALALAAAANLETLAVRRQPRVAIAATGDELVLPGGTPTKDQIIASNSVGLAALVVAWGGRPRDLGLIADDPDALTAAFSAALTSDIDVLLVSGGASVGEHDYVRGALEAAGVDIGLWRIAMRPGKPMMFGRHGTTLVFGLPGNPVSAFATALTMAVPALLHLQGRSEATPLRLPITAPLPPNGARRHFIRSSLAVTEGGLLLTPSPHSDSGHLSSLAQCDGFIDQPADDPGVEAGALVSFLPLAPLLRQ